MAKKKSSTKPSDTHESPSQTFASLHGRVSAALADEDIKPSWRFAYAGTDEVSIQKHPTHIMGRFECRNKTCSNPGWASKKIAILIRQLHGHRYNAIVFKQRCKRCNSLGFMMIDKECYVERVSYRLKKWSGIKMDQGENFGKKKGLPHEEDFCEGCFLLHPNHIPKNHEVQSLANMIAPFVSQVLRSFTASQIITRSFASGVAKKNAPKKSGGASDGPSKTFPDLHGRIAAELAGENIQPSWWFNSSGTDHTSTKEHDTHIMGQFECGNDACRNHGWSSKKVAIQIRQFKGHGYDAVVFNQRCKECESLGLMKIKKNSYVERVSYRLKRWSGINVERPIYEGKEGPPHLRHLCEGCSTGHCKAVRDDELD
ncbi:hypothetical protein VTJ49DRAFT_1305 [Mycothermus thermophilus]|uniref:3CxxC-type domain-containing protein n=1 Tax=Humicola insolens TaxID=85995 RepID=A0ABR3VD58_HUMIN